MYLGEEIGPIYYLLCGTCTRNYYHLNMHNSGGNKESVKDVFTLLRDEQRHRH